ncbi:MAG: InlB B-repeat-containing protein, partial [Clostridia bacterium]|nr:InlB B-repeat-containing protein [Clostridia bacterium]
KKFLGIALMILMLVFTLASCDMVKGMIIKHEVTFSLDGGVAGEGYTESVEIGDGKTLTLSTPTREGYNFLGWYSGETKVTESTPITSDMTLTAKWEIKTFKVSFLDYYGNTVSTRTVNYGESATAPTVDSVIEKKRFDGWSADFSKVVEDMTVNALYVDNTYTISYDLGEIGESFIEPCFYGELPKIPETPMIDGYVFFGWYLDAELTDRYFFDYKLDRDITLYAKFYDTTLGEYIVISNLEQFKAIKDQPSAKYLLACDINCKGEKLTPINSFSGELDGNGYKIHNFIILDSNYNTGLIRQNNGKIQNLSIGDYIFEITTTQTKHSYYGIISGVNNGIIDNCHILDGTFKIDFTSKTYQFSLDVGCISGQNHGKIFNCTNRSTVNIFETHTGNGNPISGNIGGIAGQNEPTGIITKCANYGEINFYNYFNPYSTGSAPIFPIGGIVGTNYGTLSESFNVANIYSKNEMSEDVSLPTFYIGGAIGLNVGLAYNAYSSGNIEKTTLNSNVHIGGFVGYNKRDSGYEAVISECFSVTNITINDVSANIGYFAGKTTGTEKSCYYIDAVTLNLLTMSDGVEITEPIESTCTVGEAKPASELLSVDFIENTLYFDRMIWLVVEGELPTLR